MSDELKSSAQKVQEALQAQGLSCEVVQMEATTRTAGDAARAVGCEVGQIVKSLIFKGKQSHRPILVVASGANPLPSPSRRFYRLHFRARPTS